LAALGQDTTASARDLISAAKVLLQVEASEAKGVTTVNLTVTRGAEFWEEHDARQARIDEQLAEVELKEAEE
jgi:hypothetical protein